METARPPGSIRAAVNRSDWPPAERSLSAPSYVCTTAALRTVNGLTGATRSTSSYCDAVLHRVLRGAPGTAATHGAVVGTGVFVHTRFAVLGPVRAWRGGMEMNLGTPKRRGLLALLLVHAGHLVAVQDIVDVLWGQDPPDRAVNVVQRHIGVLRRLLEPGLQVGSNSRWLVRGSGGYRLEVETDALDLLRFRALRRRAGAVAENGDAGQATKLMIEAMALWRGPAALGITSETRSHPVFTAVDQEHLAAVKEAAEYAQGAGADLGARVLAPLRQAAAQYPLDEALHAWLIELLAATGRQAEALDVHRTVRTRLADDLGVDPGPQLTDAQQSVLRRSANRRDTSSSGHGGSAVPDEGKEADQPEGTIPRTPIAVRPAQLPAELSVFTGRDAELDRFQRLLPAAGDCPSTLVISVIGGMAGVGKTTLAIHWAHQVADRFPTDSSSSTCEGSTQQTRRCTRPRLHAPSWKASECSPGTSPPISRLRPLYRSLLAGRRVLIVLDNARDAEQIRPLLPGAPGSLVIVTSRNQLYGLVASEGAHAVMLDLLSHEEALRFLSRRLGADRVMGAARAATEITTLCGRLPLALAIVSARAILNPAHSLESIAAALREAHGGLDGLAVEPPWRTREVPSRGRTTPLHRAPHVCSGWSLRTPDLSARSRPLRALSVKKCTRSAHPLPSWYAPICSRRPCPVNSDVTNCCVPTEPSSAGETGRRPPQPGTACSTTTCTAPTPRTARLLRAGNVSTCVPPRPA